MKYRGALAKTGPDKRTTNQGADNLAQIMLRLMKSGRVKPGPVGKRTIPAPSQVWARGRSLRLPAAPRPLWQQVPKGCHQSRLDAGHARLAGNRAHLTPATNNTPERLTSRAYKELCVVRLANGRAPRDPAHKPLAHTVALMPADRRHLGQEVQGHTRTHTSPGGRMPRSRTSFGKRARRRTLITSSDKRITPYIKQPQICERY